MLIEAVTLKAAHTHTEDASSGCKEHSRERQCRICEEGALLFAAHAGTQSGCAQRAASHKCGGRERERERERRAQAIAHRSHTPRCAMWACGPKFAQVCLRRNVPHFGQRAIDAQSVGNSCDAICSVSSAPIFIETAQLVVTEVEARQRACDTGL